jgi:hypothetical protein
MTPINNTELFDQAILQVLDANNARYGLQAAAVCLFVRPHGFQPSEVQVLERLEYLSGKGLAAEVPRRIHKTYRAWKITDPGRQYLDDNNL